MNVHDFKKIVEESGCKQLDLHFKQQSDRSRILTAENFLFFESTNRYLVTVISASLGKYSAIGGIPDERAGGTRSIGHALDEDIYFPGFFLLWASSLGYNVNSLQIDIRPVNPAEKPQRPNENSVQMVDVAGVAAAKYFVQSYELVKDLIIQKYGKAWFDDWPELLRFAYLIRNALAHDGNWGIQNQKYHHEVFNWARAGLQIQMRDGYDNLVDEGRNVLGDLNGADFVILLLEINDEICK